MDIRLVAIDLDGTLLDDDMRVTSYTRDVLREVHKRGIHLVFATGRMFCSARKKLRHLDIGDIPLVAYTGAWIGHLESGRTIARDGISVSVAASILNDARQKGWVVQIFQNDNAYMPEPSPVEKEYIRYRTKPTLYIGNSFYRPNDVVTRMIMVEPNPYLKDEIRHFLETHYGNDIEVVYPGDDFLDIHKKGVSKARAIRHLADKWHVEPENIIAFGNSENDLSMFRLAHKSYAVSNADDIVLKAADEIIPSNNEDGVAKTLEKLILDN